jgi:hypothetical protein
MIPHSSECAKQESEVTGSDWHLVFEDFGLKVAQRGLKNNNLPQHTVDAVRFDTAIHSDNERPTGS